MEPNCRPASTLRRSNWRCLLVFTLLLTRPVWAVDDTYSTLGYVNTGSGVQIAATNFLNDAGNTFSVNFTNYVGLNGWESSLYHGWYYTKNFTNNGEMDCNSGFYFNQQYPPNLPKQYMASTFYNSANINCAATFTNSFFYGGIAVWASNIINSGTITIGADGLGKFTGKNLDFTSGKILIQNPLLSGFSSAGIFGTSYGFGLNTNAWSPGFSLTPTSARSSLPYVLNLNNSTAYLYFVTNNASSNIIVRAVFLNNISSNSVAANVYFGDLFGNGQGNVEWSSHYVNPTDGSITTNYLYLENNYTESISTNIFINNGIPDNFFFLSSSTPLAAGLTQVTNTGFPIGFNYPYNSISNSYSYANVNLTSSTVDTNQTYPYDFRQLTNLLGRVEITATNNLTLSGSTIQGMNYTRFNSTNQYNNDGSSAISTTYADAYLGSTNNNLIVSNLFANVIPGWNGSVQCWSTDWTNGPDATGYTYEYKVMLVQSSLIPFNESQQQDFVLYSSNNVIVSDKLNIMRRLSINCTNLLLTINPAGNGAASFQGELNLNNSSLYWATCLPWLRTLTNNGAIRCYNLSQFGVTALPYLEFINSGTVYSANGISIVANDVTSGGNVNAGMQNFSVQAQTVALTNGVIMANGTFASTSSSLIIGGNYISNGLSITLTATNLLTDTGVTNGNIWVLGAGNSGSSTANGLVLPQLPASGDLLGTTVTNIAVAGTKVVTTWSGHDYGAVPAGFVNNAALGQLVLDAQTNNPRTCCFQFNRTATGNITNALYVDCLQFVDYSTSQDNSYNITNLYFNTNMVIYYAQALRNGVSIAEKLDHKNGDHLRWVPSYAGYFSSTNLVYPAGVTNAVNSALAQSTDIDSDGDGTYNYYDSSPIFLASQVNFTITLTNLPPKSARVQWATIPNGTNFIYYRTNLLTGTWLPFTNFNNFYYGANVAVPNTTHSNWFASPQAYHTSATNVWIFDTITNTPHYYQVIVQTWLTYPF